MAMSCHESARVLSAILEGCERVGVRVVIQASKGFLDCSTPLVRQRTLRLFHNSTAAAVCKAHAMRKQQALRWHAEDAFLLTEQGVDHRDLFRRCVAVVHHGGSGTTHTSLMCEVPTWIVPFFGDQHLWGSLVHRHGAGPPPCSIAALTSDTVVHGLRVMFEPAMALAAARLGRTIRAEDGLSAAVERVNACLPISTLVCQVSLFLTQEDGGAKPEVVIAPYRCASCGLRMSGEAVWALHVDVGINADQDQDQLSRHSHRHRHALTRCQSSMHDLDAASIPVEALQAELSLEPRVPTPPARRKAILLALQRAQSALGQFNQLCAQANPNPRSPHEIDSVLPATKLAALAYPTHTETPVHSINTVAPSPNSTNTTDEVLRRRQRFTQALEAGLVHMDFSQFAYTFYGT